MIKKNEAKLKNKNKNKKTNKEKKRNNNNTKIKKLSYRLRLPREKRYFIIYQIKIPALRYIWTTQANYTVNSLTTLGARESGLLREVAGRLREKSRK